jgi:hypothetical protein
VARRQSHSPDSQVASRNRVEEPVGHFEMTVPSVGAKRQNFGTGIFSLALRLRPRLDGEDEMTRSVDELNQRPNLPFIYVCHNGIFSVSHKMKGISF